MAGVNPTAISVASLLAGAAAGASYWMTGLSPAFFFLGGFLVLVSGVADALDGDVARRFGKVSRAGDFIDHFFDRVVETAGIYNTAGFNDDTRAYPSIPARHDVWRRAACDWAAGLLVRHIIDEQDAYAMAKALSYDLAKEVYNL